MRIQLPDGLDASATTELADELLGQICGAAVDVPLLHGAAPASPALSAKGAAGGLRPVTRRHALR